MAAFIGPSYFNGIVDRNATFQSQTIDYRYPMVENILVQTNCNNDNCLVSGSVCKLCLQKTVTKHETQTDNKMLSSKQAREREKRERDAATRAIVAVFGTWKSTRTFKRKRIENKEKIIKVF